MSEFNKTVHWRRIKDIFNICAANEDIDISRYNIDKIKCFQCFRSRYARVQCDISKYIPEIDLFG